MGELDGETVLIIEDDTDLADLYAGWLADGYDVRTTYTGEEGLERLDDEVDLVVLDRRLPGLAGDEVLSAIRERDVDPRVVMVTAVQPDFDIIEMGCDGYLVKPIARRELRDTVATLLSRRAYDATVQEYFSLVSKKAALEATKDERALAASPAYTELVARVRELRANLDALVTDFDDHDYASLFRGLADRSAAPGTAGARRPPRSPAAAVAELNGASNALLFVPSRSATETDHCRALLTRENPADTTAVHVDFTLAPADRLRWWHEHDGERPAELRLLSVGNHPLTKAEDLLEDRGRSPDEVIRTVANPANLTRIGTQLTGLLREQADSDTRLSVCVHSLTALLHYTEVDQAFRFLNEVTGQLATVDAAAHYHIEPGAHDERTVSRLRSLFDAVVDAEAAADGGSVVATR